MSIFGNGSDWFQRFANVALIASLILVGYQINQANNIARATLSTAAFQQETDLALARMGENPSAILAKSMLEPENLTPEEVLVVISRAEWRISMMARNNRMEEFGIFDNKWHSYLESQGRNMGQNPIEREYLLNDTRQEWWLEKMKEFAEVQPKGVAGERFLEVYLDAAKSYSTKTAAESH